MDSPWPGGGKVDGGDNVCVSDDSQGRSVDADRGKAFAQESTDFLRLQLTIFETPLERQKVLYFLRS